MKKHLLLSLAAAALAFTVNAQAQTRITSMDEVTDGFYQIKSVGQVYNSGNWELPENEVWWVNYSEEFSAADNNRYYPLGINPLDESQIGRSFVRLEAFNEGWAIKAQNGHYLAGNSQSAVTPYGHVLMEGNDNGTFMFQHLCGFTEDTWASSKVNAEYYGIVGKSTNNARPIEIYAAPVDDYNIYQVIFDYPEELPTAQYPYDYPSVKYTGDDCVSVAKVYEGGYYIFPKGTTPDTSLFECPEFPNYDAEVIVEDDLLIISYAAAVDMQEVIYHYFFGEEELGEEVINAVIGEPWPEPRYTGFPWGVAAHAPEGTANYNTFDIDIQVVFEGLPFEFATEAASFDDIKHWYSLSLRGTQYMHYSDTLDYIDMQVTEVDHSQENNFKWAFIGNPIEGFKVVNYAAGFGKVLANANNFDNDTNTGAQTRPFMQDEADLSDYDDVWTFMPVKSTNIADADGFYLGFDPEGGESYTFMNYRDGCLAYWTGGQDLGSTFIATELFGAQSTLADIAQRAEKQMNAVAPYVGEVGFPTVTNYKALKAAVAEGNAAYGTELSDEQVFAYVTAIEDALKAFSNDITMPKDGLRYSFTNHQKGDSVQYVIYMDEAGLQLSSQTAAEIGDAAYFFCYASEANEGKYLFQNVATGKYMIWKGHQGGALDNTGMSEEYDATLCDFSINSASNLLAGGVWICGKRANGNDGTFIATPEGVWNAWSSGAGWADGYSNVFTIHRAPTTEWSEWEPFESGLCKFTYSRCFSGDDDSLNIYVRHDVEDLEVRQIKLEHWCYDTDFIFTLNAANNCTVPQQTTAYHYADGTYDEDIMVSDIPSIWTGDGYSRPEWPCWYDEDAHVFHLNLVYTMQGGQVYFNPGPGEEIITMYLSAEGIRTLTADDDAPVYDLFGRRVEEIQKGTIYVKNGQKFMVK